MPAESRPVLLRAEVEDDLQKLDRGSQKLVLKALRERVATHPEAYGKPLSGPLAGLRRVRVGDYRVAYQVREKDVVVWAVMHRRDVYAELARRFETLH